MSTNTRHNLPAAVEQVREYIERLNLQPGDRLPVERELADELGIGLSKLREAMNVLQQMGVIDRKRRAGTFLKKADPGYLAAQIDFHIEMGTHSEDEVRRARAALETGIAVEAARHRTAHDLLSILAAIEDEEAILAQAQGQESIDSREWFQADLAFHAAVLKAAHNTILSVFGQVIAESFARIPQAMRLRYGPPARLVIAEHREIFELIQAQDAEKAQAAMHQHVTNQKPIDQPDPG